MSQMVSEVVEEMSGAYPDLTDSQFRVMESYSLRKRNSLASLRLAHTSSTAKSRGPTRHFAQNFS